MTTVACLLLLLALAACAEVEDAADRHPIRVHATWHFPPGLHRPTPHWFPYAPPERRYESD